MSAPGSIRASVLFWRPPRRSGGSNTQYTVLSSFDMFQELTSHTLNVLVVLELASPFQDEAVYNRKTWTVNMVYILSLRAEESPGAR